ncbi:hypothetical protein POM88_048278 [Heracleum sosnowskyi]|uniref:Uncharacterized protein n=1 Tax=Heracleum sosnowskyi TaxID=360622 RepID=A0AAD8M0G0_9APIA|nr:hypothetical protein POM88_048278 [Heracleum sosnowskyi]
MDQLMSNDLDGVSRLTKDVIRHTLPLWYARTGLNELEMGILQGKLLSIWSSPVSTIYVWLLILIISLIVFSFRKLQKCIGLAQIVHFLVQLFVVMNFGGVL